MRPAQHLDAIDVEILLLEQAVPYQRHRIEADRDGRIGRHRQRLRADAADLKIIACEIGLGEAHIGGPAQQLGAAFDFLVVQHFCGEHRNRNRNVLYLFANLLGGDDDVLPGIRHLRSWDRSLLRDRPACRRGARCRARIFRRHDKRAGVIPSKMEA